MDGNNVTVIGIAIFITIYLIPSFVAFKREHQNRFSILVLNIITGWSIVGWIVSLIWSVGAVTKNNAITNQSFAQEKKCPYCAEVIKVDATFCRFCRKELTAKNITVNKGEENSQKQTIHKTVEPPQYAKIKEFLVLIFGGKIKSYKEINKKYSKYTKKLPVIFALLFLIVGCIALVWFGLFQDYSYRADEDTLPWYSALWRFKDFQNSLSVIITGILLLYGKKINKHNNDCPLTTKIIKSNNVLSFNGVHTDLVVTQIILIMIISVFDYNAHLQIGNIVTIIDINNLAHKSIAIILSVVSFALSIFLVKRGNELFGKATAIINVAYIAETIINYNNYDIAHMVNSIASLFLRPPTFLNIYPYIALLFISIAMPILKLIKIADLRYGGIYGDIEIACANHYIFLPFGSALVFNIIFNGIIMFISYRYLLLFMFNKIRLLIM